MSDTALIVCPRETLTPIVMAEAEALKEAALAGCALIGKIATKDQNDAAVLAVAEVTALKKQIEKAHKDAKLPYLRVCQSLDETKNKLLDELLSEELRVNTLCGNYRQEEQEKLREAERVRQRELDRIERERIAEERRIAEEAAKVERERQAEARRVEEAAAAERRKLEQEAAAARGKQAKAEAAERLAKLEAQRKIDAAQAEQERKEREAQAERERKQREALAAQEVEAVGPQKEFAKTSGQTIKAEWDFEVINIVTLSRTRPDLVKMEAKTREIKEIIALGQKDIPGLRIFEKITTRVRPGSVGQKAIDV